MNNRFQSAFFGKFFFDVSYIFRQVAGNIEPLLKFIIKCQINWNKPVNEN